MLHCFYYLSWFVAARSWFKDSFFTATLQISESRPDGDYAYFEIVSNQNIQ